MIDKHTKIEIYARTHEIVRQSLLIGICPTLVKVCEQLTGVVVQQREIKDMFPEIWAYKPVGALSNFYWWDLRNTEIRLKILIEIIEKLSHETK